MKESFFLGLGLLLVGSLTLGFTGGRQAHTPPTVAPAAVQQVVQTTPPIIVQDAPPRIVRDTLHPVGGEDRYLELRINSAHDLVVEIMLKGVDYRFRRVNGTISNLFIDNKEIPKDEISKYSEITEKICRNADEHFSHPHLDEEASEARKLDLAAELAREAENRELVQHYMELQQKMAAQQQRAMESQLKEQLEKQQAILESQNLQLKRMNDTLEVKEAEMKLIIASIRADLINLHVVANPEEIKSFSLNKETLIVNGIRQPAEVHRHFKVKYLNDEIPEIRWDGLDLIRSDARP